MNLDASGKNVDHETHLTVHNWSYWVPLWYTKGVTKLTCSAVFVMSVAKMYLQTKNIQIIER